MASSSTNASIAPFVQVFDVNILLPIVEKRIPRSAHVYNMLLMYSFWECDMKVYVLNHDSTISENSWVVIICNREEYVKDICISPPSNRYDSYVQEAFANSSVINWKEAFHFAVNEHWLSQMIVDISTRMYGNPTEINPDKVFFMDRDIAKNLEIAHVAGTQIKELGADAGLQFLLSTWRYAKKGKTEIYMKKCVERNPSVGIFLDSCGSSEPVSGIIFYGNGRMGALHTVPDWRRNGFGQNCMKSLCKNLALKGFIPCSTVEMTNSAALHFHEKLGMTFSHFGDSVHFRDSRH